MEQFNVDKWLQDKSRKVVTRQGNPVRIICTDRKHAQSWPIIALESYDSGEFVLYANDKGRTDLANENIHDLFFADEEEELTEFEKVVQNILNEPHYQDIQAVKQWSKTLLDLARKELRPEFDKEMDKMLAETNKVVYQKGKQDALKSLPKCKKAIEDKDFDRHVLLYESEGEDRVVLATEVYEGEYYIELDDLKTLPK